LRKRTHSPFLLSISVFRQGDFSLNRETNQDDFLFEVCSRSADCPLIKTFLGRRTALLYFALTAVIPTPTQDVVWVRNVFSPLFFFLFFTTARCVPRWAPEGRCYFLFPPTTFSSPNIGRPSTWVPDVGGFWVMTARLA